MKISSTTLTTVITKSSWARLEALQKAFKKLKIEDGFVDNKGNGHEGFSFKGTLPKNFEKTLKNVLEKADAAEKEENKEDRNTAKLFVKSWHPPQLGPANELASLLDPVISDYVKEFEMFKAAKDFEMAQCMARDCEDFVFLRNIINNNQMKDAYKFARNMDTLPRESIPDKVYAALVEYR
jgi:hypothetical protein